eukprot:1858620-Rhodomonas_salina.2
MFSIASPSERTPSSLATRTAKLPGDSTGKLQAIIEDVSHRPAALISWPRRHLLDDPGMKSAPYTVNNMPSADRMLCGCTDETVGARSYAKAMLVDSIPSDAIYASTTPGC